MSQTRAQLVKGVSNTFGADDTVTVDSSGNVGIGTTSIASGGANTTNFNVHTPSSTSVYLKLSNSGTGNTASDAFDLSADSSGNAYLINRENGNMTFWTNATERMRILSSGGLTFNGDTSSVNALDDYEEGDHTCAVTAGTSGTITLSASTLSYVKIGNLVTVQGRLDVSSVSSPTGELELSMPFANGSGTKNHAAPAVFIWQGKNTEAPNNGLWVGFMGASTSTLNLRYGDSHTPGADGAAAMQANTEIRIVLTYRTV